MTLNQKTFLSDNASGAHPKIMEALTKANQGHAISYGDDPYTQKLQEVIRSQFGNEASVFPVFSGTGANVLALGAMAKSYEAILCSDVAHILRDETGAPEKFTGCKIVPIPSVEGKITAASIHPYLEDVGFVHRSQPRVISISQATEYGTLYSLNEIKAITEFAHQNQLLVHMDGARISNAAAALNLTFKQMVTEAGIDVLSFGGTKNGLMLGDAVVFLKPELGKTFGYLRKHGLQLASKMRFISAQLLALFENELWKEMATHSNQMAARLAAGLKEIKGVTITQPVQTNVVFAQIPESTIANLQKEVIFAVWEKRKSEVRLMTSFDTTSDEVDQLLDLIRKFV